MHLIANLISGCEFRTFREGTEQHGEEWAALNVRPNRNQNGPTWKHELIARMLLSGESLCIRLSDGQLIIAEAFNREEYAVRGDVFTQVSRSGFTFSRSYAADDVLFLQSPANARAAWVQQIMREYEKLMQSASGRFQKAGGERGILKVGAVAQGNTDFENQFNKLMNEYFRSYFSSRNAVLPLYDGYDYTAQSSGSSSGTYTNDLSAVKTLVDEAISRAAQLFGIPPSYLRGDAAGIRDAQSAAMTNCVKPIAAMLSAELTAKLHTTDEITKGSRIIVDTGTILHHDLIADASGADKLRGAGWTLNEILRALGQPESNDPAADQRYVTKNYGSMEIVEGGEQNEA